MMDNGNDDLENAAPFAALPPPEPMFSMMDHSHGMSNSGISVDDENPGLDQGHSLPNVDELKVDHRVGSSEFAATEDGEIKRRQGAWIVWVALFLALLVIGVIVGVAVAVTTKQQKSSTSSAASNAQQTSPPFVSGTDTPIIDQKPDNGGKDTAEDIPTPAPPTPATTSPPMTPEERTQKIKEYLIQHGVSSESALNDSSSPQTKALNFVAVEDGFLMAIPSGSTATPEGYAFMTRYILTTLYYATFGERWTFDLNFLKPTDVCAWYSVLQYVDLSTEYRGVACDEGNKSIIALFMNQNNLEGNLPTELGLLTTIINMDYDLNLLRASIPESFKQLTNMENLFASGNRLTGAIPSWVDAWQKMRNINFSHNLMTGRLPTALGNLPDMEGLAIDNNFFTNNFDGIFDSDVVPGFRKIEQFYTENNQFTGTLSANFMKEMKSISYLDISDNQIGGSIPLHLFSMPNITVLDLHDNDFSILPSQFPVNNKIGLLALQKCNFENQAIPSSISNLKSLQHLDVSQNKFNGEIPSEIGLLKNLTYLFLAQNNFSPGPIPSWLQGMTNLEELDLKSTFRTGTIPDYLGTDLSKLILLDLDNNNLVGAIPESLGNLQDLHILLLNRNNLTSVIPTSFRNLQSLKLLFLEANNAISGSLGDTFCNNPAFVLKPVIVGNCDICDVVPDCCTLCCQAGNECNDGIHVPDLDPIWQLGYQRIFFTFRREDYFMKEQNGNSNGEA